MAGEYILDLKEVKAITGAETDDQARVQVSAVQELLENYLGVTLIKADVFDEKLTVPYSFSTIIRPTKNPLNSVLKVEVSQNNGEYREYKGRYTFGRQSVQLSLQSSYRFPASVIPGGVGAVRLSYNAGLYSDYTQAPALLVTAAKGLLAWMFADPYAFGGYQSEHLSDYSYTKGATVRGIPATIAGILDGVKL